MLAGSQKESSGWSKNQSSCESIVNRAVESARPLIEARKHEFSVALPMKPIWIDADAGRLEQVFVNLLHNAANYTNPAGLIRVVVRQEADEAVVRIQDNGIGIAAEMLPHIFEMFSQIDAINKPRSHAGLGIGLALVGTVVEMHGGSVQARSAGLGKGSEFTVRLPALGSAPSAYRKPLSTKPKEKGTSSSHSDCRRQHRFGRYPEHHCFGLMVMKCFSRDQAIRRWKRAQRSVLR